MFFKELKAQVDLRSLRNYQVPKKQIKEIIIIAQIEQQKRRTDGTDVDPSISLKPIVS